MVPGVARTLGVDPAIGLPGLSGRAQLGVGAVGRAHDTETNHPLSSDQMVTGCCVSTILKQLLFGCAQWTMLYQT